MSTILFLAALTLSGSQPKPEISFDLGRARDVNVGSMMSAQTANYVEIEKAIQHAFKRYPDSFLAYELKTVYIVAAMKTDDGVEYGGTVGDDGKSVILAADQVSAEWLESVFHHETAHLLLSHHESDLPKSDWIRVAAPEFRYAHANDGAYGALKSGSVDDLPSTSLNAQGILNSYGASCFDEDWATFASAVLTATPEFVAQTKRYPRLAEKAALVEQFYEKICPSWTPNTVDGTESLSVLPSFRSGERKGWG